MSCLPFNTFRKFDTVGSIIFSSQNILTRLSPLLANFKASRCTACIDEYTPRKVFAFLVSNRQYMYIFVTGRTHYH